MYKDRLLKFSVFSFSLKGGIWLLGAVAWSVGLLDRTVSTFSDGQIVAGEVPPLMIIITALVCWLYLKPSSRLKEQFLPEELLQGYQKHCEKLE